MASGSKVPYMTQLTASVETETGYRFMNMMVNSSEIKDGDVFTVSGPMVVTANYVEKKDLASLIDKTTQTVVYNKQYGISRLRLRAIPVWTLRSHIPGVG